MKTDARLVELVCRPHCRFFRPGEKEELSCRGYDFLAERMGTGPWVEEIMERIKDAGVPAGPFPHDGLIESRLCAECSFRAEDCDFMADEAVAEAVPCGGYVVVARLRAAGAAEIEGWLDGSG